MIRYFVGVIGSGKTSIACKIMKKNHNGILKTPAKRKYDYNFANFDTSLANQIDVLDLAEMRPPERSYIAIDESGLEFNSREFKSLHMGIIEFFKLSRHFKCSIDLFSQTWDDTDKQLRDLASEIWVVRRLGPISYARCVYKRIGIDENTKQLTYIHYWKSILWQLLPFMPKQFIFCFRPLYYDYFNSFSTPDRPLIENAKPLVSTFGNVLSWLSNRKK